MTQLIDDTTQDTDNTENVVDELDITPLHQLVTDLANSLIHVERAQAELSMMETVVNDFVRENFPQLQMLRDELTDAKMKLQETESKVKEKATRVDPASLKQYGRGVYISSVSRVTAFDKEKAFGYIRANFDKAEQAGLVKLTSNKSDWLKAINNGHKFDAVESIVTIETVNEVRITQKDIKPFATGE